MNTDGGQIKDIVDWSIDFGEREVYFQHGGFIEGARAGRTQSAPSKDGGILELAKEKTTVIPVKDGPLYIKGEITVTTPEGEVFSDTRMSLCRCGASKNKPFCDNSHRRNGFCADSW
ncbi:MAG: CDGSH iron-sulfur domain-containing protein [Chloroflexota bacterium]